MSYDGFGQCKSLGPVLVTTHDTVIECIADPQPKGRLREELVPLPELVQLRVAIQESRRDELVEDTDDERREDGEDDIVQRERPGLVGDLTGEVVEEGVLQLV